MEIAKGPGIDIIYLEFLLNFEFLEEDAVIPSVISSLISFIPEFQQHLLRPPFIQMKGIKESSRKA